MCNKQFLEEEKCATNSFYKKTKRKHVFFSLCPLKILFFEKKDGHNNKTRESFPFISLFEMLAQSSKALKKKANTQAMSSAASARLFEEAEEVAKADLAKRASG